MKRKIKINCTDFHNNFDNYIFNLLNEHYQLKITKHPDIILYSNSGQEFLNYDCLRIFYTGENVRPNFNQCDYAFSFDYSDNPRNYRFPDYAAYGDVKQLIKPKNMSSIIKSKTKFCNFIYSNHRAQERIDFFKILSQYKKVDSFGKVLNNIPDDLGMRHRLHPDWSNIKLSLMKDYKFTIAFENSSYPGYTTEKIFHAFLAHTIPIYWGNPRICEEFHSKSFLNCHDFDSFEHMVELIIEIDQNDVLFRKMIEEPCYLNNEIPNHVREETVLQQLELIIQNIGKITPVARKMDR